MKKLVVYGAKKLVGMQKVQGSKNACLPIIIATLLTGGETVLHQCPILSDSVASCKILNHLGCSTKFEHHVLITNSKNFCKTEIPNELMIKMRSSIIFLGAILARHGKAIVSFPGGCKIGKRPINWHLNAFKQMGTKIKIDGNKLICTVYKKKLTGAHIKLKFPSVGATENILLAATTANGTTTIENAAIEPEIIDLCVFLKRCGAKIKGEGTKKIWIEGVEKLHPCQHKIMADRIVAATLLCATAATKGEILLSSINPSILSSVFPIFKAMNCKTQCFKNGIFFKSAKTLKSNLKIKTKPYPGFPTDLQPIFMALACTAKGKTTFEETIFENRFNHAKQLQKFGANIEIVNQKTAIVYGKTRLHKANVCATDLRGGAGALIAALAANGKSTISNIDYIDRGYEQIETQLQNLGAAIDRA